MNRLILPLMLCTQLTLAAEVAGVKVDERVKLGSSELQLNGAGIRTRLFFKVYVGALYPPERKSSATEVLALKGAKRISMTLLRDLTARQLTDALEGGIRGQQLRSRTRGAEGAHRCAGRHHERDRKGEGKDGHHA
jgi:hypothetical protein